MKVGYPELEPTQPKKEKAPTVAGEVGATVEEEEERVVLEVEFAAPVEVEVIVPEVDELERGELELPELVLLELALVERAREVVPVERAREVVPVERAREVVPVERAREVVSVALVLGDRMEVELS